MSYYNAKRKSYVCKASNKRLKGLAKNLKKQFFPEYTPPRFEFLGLCL